MKTRATDLAEKTLWLIAAIASALLAVWLIASANAAEITLACVPSPVMDRHLSATFGERIVSRGVSSGGVLFEVWAGDNGEHWTLVIAMANGASCMLATGEGWEQLVTIVPGRSG